MNVPPILGTIISRKMATLAELDTVYGLEDLHDLLEIITVDVYNERLANAPKDK